MHWNPRQARFTLLLFLLIFTAGQVKAYLARPVYPDLDQIQASWPPDGHIVDSTVLKNKSLEVFSQGTTINEAVSELGAGQIVLARLPKFPRLLLPHLKERNVEFQIVETADGAALLHARGL